MRIERITALIERSTARWNVWVALLGFLTAVLTFSTTFFGIVAGSLNSDVKSLNAQVGKLNSKNDQLTAELTQANASLDERLDAIEELKRENTALKQKIPPTSMELNAAAKVRATGQIVVATHGDTLDLNSTLANFKRKDEWTYQDTLSYDRGTLKIYGVSTLVLSDGAADYGTCSTVSGWSRTDSIEAHATTEQKVCFRLISGRFASIVANTIDENAATLMVTVWE